MVDLADLKCTSARTMVAGQLLIAAFCKYRNAIVSVVHSSRTVDSNYLYLGKLNRFATLLSSASGSFLGSYCPSASAHFAQKECSSHVALTSFNFVHKCLALIFNVW